MTPQLEKKVAQAIKLLQSIPTDKGDIELSYSGGKDSDVCLELCKMARLRVARGSAVVSSKNTRFAIS